MASAPAAPSPQNRRDRPACTRRRHQMARYRRGSCARLPGRASLHDLRDGRHCRPRIRPWTGRNWTVRPFADRGIQGFLGSLDLYVYFHGSSWIEAFGLAIAEAMATGLVTILDPSFEALFEDGAVYTEIGHAGAVFERLVASPSLFARQAASGRRLVESKFSFETYPARMRTLFDDLDLAVPQGLRAASARITPGPRAPAPAAERLRRARAPSGAPCASVASCSSRRTESGSDISRGCWRSRERMSDDVEPVFFTMSLGSEILHRQGYPVDYTPSAPKVGATDASWNRSYAHDLLGAIEAFGVSAVVFDSNYPFDGLLDVASNRRDLAWIWVRRAAWSPRHELDPELQILFRPGHRARRDRRRARTAVRRRKCPARSSRSRPSF